ncbi:GHMP kinase [bacterium]|nr:GHMP kinase [bacterium]MCI0605188.1 GHMP kinase [bacterium]
MQILAKAPTRIDLSGGTLDIWPLYLFVGEATTINLAINLYATAKLEPLPGTKISIVSKDQKATQEAASFNELNHDSNLGLVTRLIQHFSPEQGFQLETDCQAPAGAGLGGSSSLAIAVCGALNEFTGKNYSPEQLIRVARDVEAQVLGIPTGRQDYYAAMFGGFNAWHFRVEKVEREAYQVSPDELRERLLLFYSGQRRSSGMNNWQIIKNRIDGDSNTVEMLQMIKQETEKLHKALKEEDWGEAYEAIHHEWMARKRLAPSITTPEIEELIEFGITNGSRTGRVCGAGGGGCVVFVIDNFTRQYLYDLAKGKKYHVLDFEVAQDGLSVQTS